MPKVVKEKEVRTGDLELKAIHAIRRAIDGLDSQGISRVLMYCIDRARQEQDAVAMGEKRRYDQEQRQALGRLQYGNMTNRAEEEPAMQGAMQGVGNP